MICSFCFLTFLLCLGESLWLVPAWNVLYQKDHIQLTLTTSNLTSDREVQNKNNKKIYEHKIGEEKSKKRKIIYYQVMGG